MQHSLDAGILRGVEMLDAGVGGDAAAKRIEGEVLYFQISVRQLISSLEASQLHAIAGGDGRKRITRDFPVDGDVSEQRLIGDGLVVQLTGE